MDKAKYYLFGLLCGRGHIYLNDKKLIIEFAHKNPKIKGIAVCHSCGYLATIRSKNNPEKNLYCKKCGEQVPKSAKKEYEQKESSINSINTVIIPFLSTTYTNAKFEVIGNNHMTYLIISFENDDRNFNNIVDEFNQNYSFDSFEIPDSVYSTNKSNKIEFVNGLIDTSGFFNSGGWQPFVDNGERKPRMRGYFQIVRNWKMPVQICNFLKTNLNLPIDHIDWGHPNIRDANMEDFYKTNKLSWSREHQIKFYPEYYSIFNIRIKHKQKMFNELESFNKNIKFKEVSDCDPPTRKRNIKPIHKGENDNRLPLTIRKHHDSYCQVCHNMGCSFSKEKIDLSNYPDSMYHLGIDEEMSDEKIKELTETKSIKKANEIHDKFKNQLVENRLIERKKIKSSPEQELYEPLVGWYKDYLLSNGYSDPLVYDTSAFYLDNFIIQNDLYNDFGLFNDLKIKPDIVGFTKDNNRKNLMLMEVKVDELTLIDLGQLLGYCLVANPKQAILVSPKEPNLNLKRILNLKPELLYYSQEKKIEIATWVNNKCVFLNY